MRHELRLLNLVLIMVFIFCFTACTTPKTAIEKTPPESTIQTTQEPKPEVVVFNDMALETKIHTATGKTEGDIRVAEAEASLSSLWQRKTDLVI